MLQENFGQKKEPSMSYWHLMLNRNKRGLALDIKNRKEKKYS